MAYKVGFTRCYGFNPGIGMQTTNAVGGTETIFHCNLASPPLKDTKVGPAWEAGDDLLLLTTKTSNRISSLNVFNSGGGDASGTFFFAFLNDGKIVFPKYSGSGLACKRSLASGVNTAGDAHVSLAFTANSSHNVWTMGFSNAGTGGGYSFSRRANDTFTAGNVFSPITMPNIGAIMDTALRTDDPATNGLKDMSVIDTDVIICMNLTAGLTQAEAANVVVKIGIIETDISARNESEDYVRNWNRIPANGVLSGTDDGYILNYQP